MFCAVVTGSCSLLKNASISQQNDSACRLRRHTFLLLLIKHFSGPFGRYIIYMLIKVILSSLILECKCTTLYLFIVHLLKVFICSCCSIDFALSDSSSLAIVEWIVVV